MACKVFWLLWSVGAGPCDEVTSCMSCRCCIDAMSLAAAAPSRLGLSPGSLPRPGVPLVYVAAGLQEVGLWDVLDGQCHQVSPISCRHAAPLGLLAVSPGVVASGGMLCYQGGRAQRGVPPLLIHSCCQPARPASPAHGLLHKQQHCLLISWACKDDVCVYGSSRQVTVLIVSHD